MSNTGSGKPEEKTIPGMTSDPDAAVGVDAPDEPAADDDDGTGPVDDDNGVIGVEHDDTVGVNQDDDDRRFGGVAPRSGQ